MFKDIEQIDGLFLHLFKYRKKIPLLSISMHASIGVLPQCEVTFASGALISRIQGAGSNWLNADTVTNKSVTDMAVPGERCDVLMHAQGQWHVLFKGVVYGQSSSYNTSMQSISVTHTLTLALQTATIDTLPVAATSLLSGVDSNVLVKSSFLTIKNANFSNAVTTITDPNVNIAAYIKDIMDHICFDPVDVNKHGRAIAGSGNVLQNNGVHIYDCPALHIKLPGNQSVFADTIAQMVIKYLEAGYTYWNAFVEICKNFYLMVVPLPASGMMSVIPDLAWRKKIDVKLKASDLISVSQSMYHTGKNEVDAVVVHYNEAANPDPYAPVDPVGAVVYGEGIKGTTPCAITDPKDLKEDADVAPRKYITQLLPSWLHHFGTPLTGKTDRKRNKDPQDPVCTTVTATGDAGWNKFAIKWASMIARTMFAQLNRAKATATLRIRPTTYLSLLYNIGSIIAFEPAVDALTVNQVKTTHVGRLQGLSLNIQMHATAFEISCIANLSHVRTMKENDILGIDESVYEI